MVLWLKISIAKSTAVLLCFHLYVPFFPYCNFQYIFFVMYTYFFLPCYALKFLFPDLYLLPFSVLTLFSWGFLSKIWESLIYNHFEGVTQYSLSSFLHIILRFVSFMVSHVAYVYFYEFCIILCLFVLCILLSCPDILYSGSLILLVSLSFEFSRGLCFSFYFIF